GTAPGRSTRTPACRARGCPTGHGSGRTRCSHSPWPARAGSGGCSPSGSHSTESLRRSKGQRGGEEGELVGVVIDLLVEGLADAVTGIAIDAEQRHGIRLLALQPLE